MASKKGSKKAPSGSKSGIKGLAAKRLSAHQATAVRGGGKRKDGTGGGNVAGGWDLIGNKVNA